MRSFMNVANLVKNKRVEHPKKYSQGKLSRALGYKNGQFISNLERGLCSIPLKGMKNFIEVLDIDKNELKQAVLKDFEETIDYYLNEFPESEKGEGTHEKRN